jgi:uncharacterized protein (TIGR02145 family)
MIRSFWVPGLLLAFAACERNHAPEITGIICIPDSRHAGTVYTFRASASDIDANTLVYKWSSETGTFLTPVNLREIEWQSPVEAAGKTVVMTVTVSDGEKGTSKDYPLTLEEPELGSLEGYVYFTNFKIPVPDATVTLGDRSCTTDDKGFFGIYEVPALTYTLSVTRESFSAYHADVKLAPNDTLATRAEITSVNYTTKLSGYVYDQNRELQADVSLVVLNPDGSGSNLKYLSEEDGYYQLRYIPFGTRTIVATKEAGEDYTFETLKLTQDFNDIETNLDLVIKKHSLIGTFTDPRDGHQYSYKQFRYRSWMTENLAYLPAVYPPDDRSTREARYYVYGYEGNDTTAALSKANYRLYGVMYNWKALESACPPGWRVPSLTEWNNLNYEFWPESGKKMKSASGWIGHGNGSNISKFNAFPGGQLNMDGLFLNEGEAAFFWTSSEANYQIPYFINLRFDSDEVLTHKGSAKMGISIRCVKN